MKKRLMSILLTLALLLTLAPAMGGSARAESGTTGSCSWNLSNGTLTISGSGAMGDCGTFGNNQPWYNMRGSITSIVVSSGVGQISTGAFCGCDKATSVKIASSVSNIGLNAFSGCGSLNSLTIEDGDTPLTIGQQAFYGCRSLTTLTLPNRVTTLSSQAFENCVLLSTISIGKNLNSISYNAFNFCRSITGIAVHADNESFKAGEDSVLYSKNGETLYICPKNLTEVTIAEGVKTIASYAFKKCEKLTAVTLPDSVTEINLDAFKGCSSLSAIKLSAELRSIGQYAFDSCEKLVELNIPAKVRTIQSDAFEGCASLSRITVDEENKSFKTDGNGVLYSFDGKTLIAGPRTIENVTVAVNTETIGRCAFSGCAALKSVKLPVSVSSIGYNAFKQCDVLTEVFYEGSEEQWAALKKNISSGNNAITKNDKLTVNYDCVFDNKCGEKLTWELAEDGTLTVSGESAMYDFEKDGAPWKNKRGKIKKAVLEDGVESIGAYAFQGCAELGKVTIPVSVKSIGANAFDGCTKLETVEYAGSSVDWKAVTGGDALKGKVSFNNPRGKCGENLTWEFDDGTLSVSGSGEMYEWSAAYDEPWSRYSNLIRRVVIGKGVESVSSYAFYYCTVLEELTLPEGLKTIGSDAFYSCGKLKSVSLPEGLKTVGQSAFNSCGALESLTLPEGIETIDDEAFYGCQKLKSFTLPEGLETIGKRAFYDCDTLTSLELPASLTTIDDGAFGACNSLSKFTVNANNTVFSAGTDGMVYSKNAKTLILCPGALTTVNVPAGVESIGNYAFYESPKLQSVALPESVKSIGDSAFRGCDELTSVKLPSGLKSIAGWAFKNCGELKSIQLPAGLESIGDYAFNASGLTSVEIPGGVKSIGEEAFADCGSLSEVHFGGTWTEWGAVSKGKNAIPETVKLIVKEYDSASVEFSRTEGVRSAQVIAPNGGTLVIAVYDAEGRLASVRTVTVSASATEIQSVPTEIDTTVGCSYRLMLLGDGFAPLCKPAEARAKS